MKKYKALMLDVDGTLSNYSTTNLPLMPTEKVINAIQKAKKHVFVGLATSRPLKKVNPIIEKVGFNGYSILHNGAQIIDTSMKTVWERTIDESSLKILFSITEKYNILTYCSDFNQNINIKSFDQIKSASIGDYFFDGIPNEVLVEVENTLSTIPNISIHKMYSKWEGKSEISITHKDATKETAIVEVARLLKISTEDIIGVGDGYNDIPLLNICGLKVAMGNAEKELKNIADVVTNTVENDGVKSVIEKYILNI